MYVGNTYLTYARNLKGEIIMAILCDTIDLDLDDLGKVYQDAQETIKYLQDVSKSIEKRVLSGEDVDGLKIVPGKKSRTITEQGLKYLEKTLGKENVYKTVVKPIGITELEKLVEPDEMAELYTKNVVTFKEGKPKVVPIKKKESK